MVLDVLRTYSTWLLIVLVSCLTISVVFFLISYRHARRDALFMWRKAAAARSRALFGVILILILAIGGVFWLILIGPSPTPVVYAAPSVTPAATPIVATRAVAVAASETPAPPPATHTPIPTQTPIPQPSATATVAPTLPARPGFSDVVLARGVSADKEPVAPGNDFPQISAPIYAFFSYYSMMQGSTWSYAWFRDDMEMTRETQEWTWGWAGRAYVFYEPLGGYTPGEYRVRFYLGNQLQAEASFAIH
jgi:hypothetical protein